ncbi:hypothetical protein XFPR_13000 [Xylella fastidiosa]|uniref:hypothetical protein n=1 Tax=Xylella fastidiosa TaxID=2371 RepID=UPI0013140825|nr:hypothetical protein [Xylella fastidiosa]QPB72944.1 hypothetical protein XFPR_13000 [Xylella fastidiosa]
MQHKVWVGCHQQGVRLEGGSYVIENPVQKWGTDNHSPTNVGMRCASHTSAAVTRLFRHGLTSKNIVPATEQQQTRMTKWLWLQQSDVVFILLGVY